MAGRSQATANINMGEEDACPLLALANALAERGDLEQCNPKASAKRQRDDHSESSSKDSHYPSPTPTHGASDDSAFAVRTSKRQCRGANVAAHTAALRSDVILPRNDEDTATEDEGDDGGHHIRTYATTDTDATVSAVSQGRKGSKTQSATQLSQTSSKKKKEQKAQASSSNAQQNQKQGQGMSQTQTSSYRGVTKHRVTGKFEAHLWDPDYTRQTNGKGCDTIWAHTTSSLNARFSALASSRDFLCLYVAQSGRTPQGSKQRKAGISRWLLHGG